MRVATDIGGTFTDLVSFDYDPDNKEVTSVKVSKASTTPGEFEKGIINAINNINLNLENIEFFCAWHYRCYQCYYRKKRF